MKNFFLHPSKNQEVLFPGCVFKYRAKWKAASVLTKVLLFHIMDDFFTAPFWTVIWLDQLRSDPTCDLTWSLAWLYVQYILTNITDRGCRWKASEGLCPCCCTTFWLRQLHEMVKSGAFHLLISSSILPSLINKISNYIFLYLLLYLLRLGGAECHPSTLAANRLSACWRSHLNEANRTTSSAKPETLSWIFSDSNTRI